MKDDLTEDTYEHLFKRLSHICSYAQSKGSFIEHTSFAYMLEVTAEIVRRHGTGVLQDVPPVDLRDPEQLPY